MAKNDTQITKLRDTIKTKREQLGKKPRAAYETSGVLTYKGSTYNFNVLTLDAVMILAAELHSLNKSLATVVEAWDMKDHTPKFSGFKIDTWIQDLELRASIIQYDAEKKKLDKLENKLKNLMSEDAKTAEALAEISDMLS